MPILESTFFCVHLCFHLLPWQHWHNGTASQSERGASFHSSFSKWKQIRPPGGSRLPLPFALELAKLLRLRAADPPSLREFNDPLASSHCLTCSKAQHFPGVRCERASRHPSWPRYSFGSQAQFWLFRPFPNQSLSRPARSSARHLLPSGLSLRTQRSIPHYFTHSPSLTVSRPTCSTRSTTQQATSTLTCLPGSVLTHPCITLPFHPWRCLSPLFRDPA